MIIGKINDKTEIDDCVLREATVSEEQLLFNKLNWENQQMILRIMRCLQPCEIIEEDKKIEKIDHLIGYDIRQFEDLREYVEITTNDLFGKTNKIIDKINEIIEEINKR